jgi:hypothetical protein
MPFLHYDNRRRRLWIAGQRCHHGATGALLATVAATAAVATRDNLTALSSLMAAGSLLMAHDWQDRAVWFQPGWQSEA